MLIDTLTSLGYCINYKKCNLIPSYSVKYIGYLVITNKDKDTIWLQIPKDRIKKVNAESFEK